MRTMNKCGGCGKFLSPTGGAVCAKCAIYYHKHCSGVLGMSIPKNWICQICSTKTVPSHNDENSPTLRNQQNKNRKKMMLQMKVVKYVLANL